MTPYRGPNADDSYVGFARAVLGPEGAPAADASAQQAKERAKEQIE